MGDFLNVCLDSEQFYPLVLALSQGARREFEQKLGESLRGRVMVLDCQVWELALIFRHLDLLVAPTALVRHMGDLTDTPLVELNGGEFPCFEHSTVREGNVVVRQVVEDGPVVGGEDILQACLFLQDSRMGSLRLTKNVVIYQVLHWGGRCEYLPAEGHFSPQQELSRLVAKDLVYLYSDLPQQLLFSSFYKKLFAASEIVVWVDEERASLLRATTALFDALRSLQQAKVQKKKNLLFVKSLDQLLNFCQEKSVVAIPIILFRSGLEAICIEEYSSNIDTVEKELFSLKNNLQKLSIFINSLVEVAREKSGNSPQRLAVSVIDH